MCGGEGGEKTSPAHIQYHQSTIRGKEKNLSINSTFPLSKRRGRLSRISPGQYPTRSRRRGYAERKINLKGAGGIERRPVHAPSIVPSGYFADDETVPRTDSLHSFGGLLARRVTPCTPSDAEDGPSRPARDPPEGAAGARTGDGVRTPPRRTERGGIRPG